MIRFLLFFALCVVTLSVYAATDEPRGNYAERPAGQAFLESLEQTEGVDMDQARALLADAEFQPDIVAAMRRPAEKTLTWKSYRPIFLGAERSRKGAEFIAEHAAIFDAVEREYGVPPHVIAAIIGVETRYGDVIGDDRVLDALATLAFDYPERSDYFTRELANFIQLCVEEDLACEREVGSYAGAMGWPQFMPSSYRAYAVDFNDNGKRDLWQEPADVIASVANYLAVHGWKADHPVTRRAWVAQDSQPLTGIERSTLDPHYDWNTLQQAGLRVDDPPAVDTRVGLLQLEGADGTEFWLGLPNFFVITTYNHSPLYAMAVYQLSQEIAAARAGQPKTSP